MLLTHAQGLKRSQIIITYIKSDTELTDCTETHTEEHPGTAYEDVTRLEVLLESGQINTLVQVPP